MARKALPWFRFYTEAPSDRKMRRLRPEQRWVVACVWGLARQSPYPGQLMISDSEPVTLDDLADYAGVTPKLAQTSIDRMLELGLLEQDEDVWIVPAWHRRQYASDTSTDRVRAHRTAAKEPSTGVPVTANGTGQKRSKEHR